MSNCLRFAVALTALGVLLGLSACHRKQQPSDVNIWLEDFGSGLRLMTNEADARNAATASGIIKVVTPEELAQSDPFGSSGAGQDVVLAVLNQLPTGGPPGITELRCYASSSGTGLTIQGESFGTLDPDRADKLFQLSGQRTESGGEIHVDYSFGGGSKEVDTALALSFRQGSGCYAARLRIVTPKEFGR